jgi:phosphoribosylformylglycinamidine synthase
VSGLLADNFLARARVRHDGRQVPHGSGRHEQTGLTAEDLGSPLLQPVDRGIFQKHVVADNGFRHGAAHGLSGGIVPQPKPNARQVMWSLHQTMQEELVEACHDLSEGGLAVALAEMCIAGRLGAEIELAGSDHPISFLFSESLARFIVEVTPENEVAFKLALDDCQYLRLGTVSESPKLTIRTVKARISLSVTELETAWRGTAPMPEYSEAAVTLAKPAHAAAPLTSQPRTLILHANGTNRDREAALACQLAGADPEIVHVNQLLTGERELRDYQMLVVPGGFSYGDDLGAGVLWALDLQQRLVDSMAEFIAQGRPVLGICNGFQALVKAGYLPGGDDSRPVTLTYNERQRFECRWVYLKANPDNPSPFLDGLDDLIYCPVAHGEGRIAIRDDAALQNLKQDNLIALSYVNADGSAADYPANPNGSAGAIAALTNKAGNVMGLMPHPENHIFARQHPRWRRGEHGLSGLRLFENAVRFA